MQGRQRGAVLVVTLVMLVMALMLGLSSFQSARLEESMAGNQRASVSALMAAEYGVSELIGDLVETDGWSSLSVCDASLDIDDWSPAGLSMNSESFNGGDYDHYECVSAGGNIAYFFVVGKAGGVTREVAANYLLPGGFLNFSPITIPAIIRDFISPNSDAFEVEGEEVDGVFQPAVSTNGQKSEVESAINAGPDRLDNYKGGVSDEISESILQSANVNDFVSFVDVLIELANGSGGECQGTCTCNGFGTSLSADDPESCITYVPGTYEDSGNFTGSGIMVVGGDLLLSGTPSFDGLVIVLGETYSLDGAGQGGVNGSLLLAGYAGGDDGSYSYREMDVTVAGGGRAQYQYDSAALENAFSLIRGTDAEQAWLAGNSGGTGEIGYEKWRVSAN